MKNCTLRIIDQVNCKFEGVDPITRKKIHDKLRYMVPYARHVMAFKLGRWDGKVAYATPGGSTFINLLDRVLDIVEGEGYEIDISYEAPEYRFELQPVDENYLAYARWPDGHPHAGEPVVLREHQIGAINRYLENHGSVQEISTSAGKTVITGALSKTIEPYGRSLIIVPGKDLVTQTEDDYKMLGLDVGVFYGDRKEYGHKHTICTWQSLAALFKRDKKGEIIAHLPEPDFAEFIRDTVCVMVDEVHSAKAKVLHDLLTGPLAFIPLRWGLTGTIPKEEYESTAIMASLGPKVGEVRADQLQELGILSNCHIDIIRTIDDHVSFDSYDTELEFLTSDKTRVAWMIEQCKAIAGEGNTLILVGRVELGKQIAEAMGAPFIYGQVKSKDRKKEYKEVAYVDNKPIVATYGVAAVGINIPRIFNLILIEPGKSFTRVIQSIGRGIRRAQDKDFVNIFDFCSTTKYSSKHLTKRKSYYRDANYPFDIVKIAYR